MTIDQKVKILQLEPEDGMPGNENDIRAFFEAETAKKEKIYREMILSGKHLDLNASAKQEYKGFKVIRENTYAKGIANLKAKGQKPFTHEQNVEAILIDYLNKGKESELFKTGLDSTTAAAYKAHTTKFKIIPDCDLLRKINPNFNQPYLPKDYDSFPGPELDHSDKDIKYNQPLTREEAKNHPAHLAAMNNNIESWEKYVDTWFDKTGKEKGIGFYTITDPNTDQLHSVALDSDYFISNVRAYNLNHLPGVSAHFASEAQ